MAVAQFFIPKLQLMMELMLCHLLERVDSLQAVLM
jgi:hypothetical protein